MIVASAIDEALVGAALVTRSGRVVARAGAIDEDEAAPLVAVVMYRLKRDDLAARLFAGEVLTLALDGRDVALAVARRQLFVVAVLAAATPDAVESLRSRVAAALAEADTPIPSSGGAGGSGSGPAELPLVEYGVTVPRAKA